MTKLLACSFKAAVLSRKFCDLRQIFCCHDVVAAHRLSGFASRGSSPLLDLVLEL